MNCPICDKPRSECRDNDCRIIAIQQAFTIAGPVMEAWANSEDLHDWQDLCEYIYGTGYPPRIFDRIETWKTVPEENQ